MSHAAPPVPVELPGPLGALLGAYIERDRYVEQDPFEDIRYVKTLSALRTEQGAQDQCDAVSTDLAAFLCERGVPAKVSAPRAPSAWGFAVRDENYLTGHVVCLACWQGVWYSIDLTAAQYGDPAFPRVARAA